MRYSDDIIDEVIHRNDIVELIGENVRLKRSGSNYTGLCPFHNEKTPSFSVSPSKQMYYCFGCHAGGNIITFVMEYYNYTFVEALKYLADRAGIELPEEELTEEQKAASRKRNRFLDAYKMSANFYYYRLKTPVGESGMKYLKGRGLTDETIKKFGLGYADKYGDTLYRYLKQKGFDDSFLKGSGLFHFDEKRGARDLFYNRVMFPILDARGRVIGFGGRVMGDAKPKYLNSPETYIFNKRRNLFALNVARSTKRGYIILCEGYMDVITMHQAGFTNAVASLGTALTPEQCALLRRFTNEVRLIYDSDNAGVNAALRAIPLLKEAGIRSRVVNLRPHKDPDEFINALGAEEFEKRLDESENSFLFECTQMSGSYRRSDPGEWTEFTREVAKKLLKDFPEDLERENYLEAVCARFGFDREGMRKLVIREARVTGADMDRGDYGRAEAGGPSGENGRSPGGRRDQSPDSGSGRNQSPGGGRDRNSGRVKESPETRSEKLMLSYLVNYPEAYGLVKDIVRPEDYHDPLARRTADILYEQLEHHALSEAALVAQFPESEEQREAAGIFHRTIPVKDGGELDQAFTDTVIRMVESANSFFLKSSDTGDIAAYQAYITRRNRLEELKSGKRKLHLEERSE